MKRGWLLPLFLVGCAEGNTSTPLRESLEVNQSAHVELRYLRFDVSNFEKRLTREDILDLPAEVRDRLWLFDLDLSSGPNTPQLLDNALRSIRELDPSTLGQAERNMQTLLRMTPDSANLQGSSIESLIDLAPLLGVASEQVLADLFTIDVESPFLTDTVVASTILKNVIGSHPNAQLRLGEKTESNPRGIYPVSAGALPVTLTDLVSNFTSFGQRFGPYARDGVTHPGFVAADTTANVLTDDFAITVRVSANALPYKGIDLSNVSVASVNSVRSQIEGIFDFQDPNWLKVDGLIPGEPTLDSLTFRIVEDKAFIKGGLSPYPQSIGSSSAWVLPDYTLEHVLVTAAQGAYKDLNSKVAYSSPGHDEPLFSASVSKGWQEITVQGGIGSPPQGCYVWDLLLEVAQVRLHDGELKEGEANVEFTLRDVPIGTDTETLERRVRENLETSPSSLLELTETVLDSTSGAADIYYYRAQPENEQQLAGDWLFFVVQGDIGNDKAGNPRRSYGYRNPGFFSDAELTNKVSTLTSLDGDTEHEKVRLSDHRVLFVEDDQQHVFRISQDDKPSQNRIALSVERVR